MSPNFIFGCGGIPMCRSLCDTVSEQDRVPGRGVHVPFPTVVYPAEPHLTQLRHPHGPLQECPGRALYLPIPVRCHVRRHLRGPEQVSDICVWSQEEDDG